MRCGGPRYYLVNDGSHNAIATALSLAYRLGFQNAALNPSPHGRGFHAQALCDFWDGQELFHTERNIPDPTILREWEAEARYQQGIVYAVKPEQTAA